MREGGRRGGRKGGREGAGREEEDCIYTCTCVTSYMCETEKGKQLETQILGRESGGRVLEGEREGGGCLVYESECVHWV